MKQGKAGEIVSEVAAVNGGETVGVDRGMGGDEKIRDRMLAWAAFLPVAQKRLPGQPRALRVQRIEANLNCLAVASAEGKEKL